MQCYSKTIFSWSEHEFKNANISPCYSTGFVIWYGGPCWTLILLATLQSSAIRKQKLSHIKVFLFVFEKLFLILKFLMEVKISKFSKFWNLAKKKYRTLNFYSPKSLIKFEQLLPVLKISRRISKLVQDYWANKVAFIFA